MGIFDFFRKKRTLEEMDEENRKFLKKSPEPANEQDAKMRQASSYLTSGKFQQSIDLFQQMAKDYPDSRGTYLSQVGAGHFFLGDFEKAIEYYLLARDAGFDEDMSDDNIWEACEAIYKQNKHTAALHKYIELCPSGNHTKKANKLLGY